MRPEINRPVFFDIVRRSLFGGRLSASQIEGMQATLDYWEWRHAAKPLPFLAYIFATDKRESDHTMQPVEEGSTRLKGAALRKWQKALRYYPWYGRGKPQTTWKRNYQTLDRLYNIGCVQNPSVLLDLKVSTKVMVEGMLAGIWTSRKLEDYWDGETFDFIGARRIINGTDEAQLIAGYAQQFLYALEQATSAPQRVSLIDQPDSEEEADRQAEPELVDVVPEPVTTPPEEQATGKPWWKSSTILSSLAAMGTTATTMAAQIFEAIDWKVAGVLTTGVVIVACVWIISERRDKSRRLGV